MEDMELQSMTLRKCSSWDKTTGYTGDVTFSGDLGEVKLRVDDNISRRILEVCKDELIAATQLVAEKMVLNLAPPPPPPPMLEHNGSPDDHGVNIGDAAEDAEPL